jgi:hypothetical protein
MKDIKHSRKNLHMKIKNRMLLHADYVVADKLFLLQSDVEIKNSSEGNQ